MKKKTTGFGLGGKNGGERKRDEPPKKKVPTVTSNWGTKKAETKETAEPAPGTHQPSYEVREIEIADIKIERQRGALNPEKLNDLMQSIPVLGLRQPITVRAVERRSNWKDAKREYALVTGFHRLEAKKRLGDTTIACIIMEGDERVARMWEISENLHRAELTPFEHDEQLVEWFELLKSEPGFSAQNVQKKGRGRPKGGISEAARRLPVKGTTHAARRRTVGRALKVADIRPEAKDAVKKAGLDKNRSKYLKVAAEKTLEAQLAKVDELAAETKNKRSLGTKQKTTKPNSETRPSAEEKKILEHLIELWNNASELKQALNEAPPNVRELFISIIQRHQTPRARKNGRPKRSQWG